MKVEPIVLEGDHVRLRPMTRDDVDELFAVSTESLWELTINVVRERDDMVRYVDAALEDADRGTALPFVTTDLITGEIVGSTRFGNIDIANRKVEIGWTWIIPSRQRSAVNTEVKLLMLTHAFEIWRCIRVELKTDALNVRSRNAIKRIGGVEEGILRNHLITDAGRFRDSVYFSIIEDEWPDVKQNLKRLLTSR